MSCLVDYHFECARIVRNKPENFLIPPGIRYEICFIDSIVCTLASVGALLPFKTLLLGAIVIDNSYNMCNNTRLTFVKG